MRSLIAFLTVSIVALGSHAVRAEQRALLVGVGKYRLSQHNLPAIDLDLERMHKTLNLMGFEDSQIHRLLDEKATSRNVVKEFKTWLRAGVEKNDRVVFYFSGHGSFVPDQGDDEQDFVDEVLVTHDVRHSTWNNKATLRGVVTDDTLAELIADIPSTNILTLVDACHSGTVTRDISPKNKKLGGGAQYEKTLIYPGMPIAANKPMSTRGIGDDNGDDNFVSLSAAGDGEKALGTSEGGVFTMGISKAIEEAARSGTTLTVSSLRDSTARFIRENVDKDRVHTPQVTGSSTLASSELILPPLRDGNGPNRKKLIALVEETDNAIEFVASANTYAVGDLLEMTIDVPIDGYLNIVAVDSRDEATVLFPNKYRSDNEVPMGPFSLPTTKMGFKLPAQKPLGSTLLVSFVTRERLNFYEQNLDQRNEDGTIIVSFTTLSTAATRGFGVEPTGDGKYATQIEVTVTD